MGFKYKETVAFHASGKNKNKNKTSTFETYSHKQLTNHNIKKKYKN